MKTFKLVICAGLASLFLSSCARISSNVSTFHDLPPNWRGSSVSVLPYDAEMQNSLEWKSYKAAVENRLRQAGFVPSDTDAARFVAYFGYAIDRGRDVVSSYSIPQFGVTGYSGGTTYGTVTSIGSGYSTYSGTTALIPTYGVTGYSTRLTNSTVFTRSMSVDMVDREGQKKVWEMKLTSQGRCGALASVMPTFIEAAFKEFPGESGDAKRIDLPYDGKC